jgi:uncharacterized protein YoxC
MTKKRHEIELIG